MAGPLTPLPQPPPRRPAASPHRRRLVVVTLLAVLFVLAALVVRLGLTPPPTEPPAPAPTAAARADTPTAAESPPTATARPTDTPTPGALTPVVAAPTGTPTSGPSPTPTWTPAWAPPTRTPAAVVTTPSPTPAPAAPTPPPAPVVRDSERVRNGDFEAGFTADGVALGWTRFSNGGAAVTFGDENAPPAVYDAYHAQLIRIEGATQPDRYAGIYQVLDVVPGASYRLSVHGLVRSTLGDVARSQYGYRMQLGVDEMGGKDWRRVADWIELPWDEQPFDAPEFTYGGYEQTLEAVGPRLTLFIRAWHKWADPVRADYTIDGVSLVGPTPFGSP